MAALPGRQHCASWAAGAKAGVAMIHGRPFPVGRAIDSLQLDDHHRQAAQQTLGRRGTVASARYLFVCQLQMRSKYWLDPDNLLARGDRAGPTGSGHAVATCAFHPLSFLSAAPSTPPLSALTFLFSAEQAPAHAHHHQLGLDAWPARERPEEASLVGSGRVGSSSVHMV